MSALSRIAIAGCLALLGGTGAAFAHGGGLNAEGCHTNRKTGEYHCHTRPAARAALGRPGAAEPDRPDDTVSCYDFIGDWRAAQDFFEKSGPGDPFRLDGDGDGVACEILKWYDAPDPGHGDRDCAHFDGSWRKAQDFYEAN